VGDDLIRTAVPVHSSHKPRLEKEVEAGRFRRDLWYRLTVFPIFVPAAPGSLEDIRCSQFLVEKYASGSARSLTHQPETLTAESLFLAATSGNWRIS